MSRAEMPTYQGLEATVCLWVGSRKPKVSYALENYLGQPAKEEAWNKLFGFFSHEYFDESAE